MNWNNLSGEDRLSMWKSFREDLKELTLEEKLRAISKYSSSIPFGTRSIDYYTPDSWPTPWEILFYGSFCTSSITLLIYYTLIIIEKDIDIVLLLVENERGIYLLPLIQNQYILNYESTMVNIYPDVKDEFKILKRYTRSDIKEIK